MEGRGGVRHWTRAEGAALLAVIVAALALFYVVAGPPLFWGLR
jgi:hypothetical protein